MAIWARVAVSDDVVQELLPYDPTEIFADDPDYRLQQIPETYESFVKTGWTLDISNIALPSTIEEFEVSLEAKIADKRWERQVAGIVINGNRFLSDPANLGIVSGAIQGGQVYESQAGPGTFGVNWKSQTGFVQLSLMGLVEVGMFGLNYTQQCFTREGEITAVLEAIVDGAGTDQTKTIALIDAYNTEINTGWPSNVYNTPPAP